MSETNTELVRRIYEDIWVGGDVSLVDRLYNDAVELHLAGVAEDPFGPEPVKQLVKMVRTAFPSLRVTLEDLISQGDKVVANVTMHGDFQGAITGASPKVNVSTWRRIDIYRFFDGQVVEQWSDRDDHGRLTGLGVLMPPAET